MDNDDDASGSQPPENSEFGGSPSEERLHFYPFLRDHIIRGGKPSRTNATNGGGGETEAKMNRVQLTKLPLERLRGIHARSVDSFDFWKMTKMVVNLILKLNFIEELWNNLKKYSKNEGS